MNSNMVWCQGNDGQMKNGGIPKNYLKPTLLMLICVWIATRLLGGGETPVRATVFPVSISMSLGQDKNGFLQIYFCKKH